MSGTVAVPTFAHMLTVYADDAIDLSVDLLAIFLLALVLYFRRHRLFASLSIIQLRSSALTQQEVAWTTAGSSGWRTSC
jgi:hypothetical protein